MDVLFTILGLFFGYWVTLYFILDVAQVLHCSILMHQLFFYISSFGVFMILQIDCYTLYFSFIPFVGLFNQTLLCFLLLYISGSTTTFSHRFHTRCTCASFQKSTQ